jgi:hypothetical protein
MLFVKRLTKQFNVGLCILGNIFSSRKPWRKFLLFPLILFSKAHTQRGNIVCSFPPPQYVVRRVGNQGGRQQFASCSFVFALGAELQKGFATTVGRLISV